MVTNRQLNFVKHFFGLLLLFIGIAGSVLPLIPGIIFIGMALTLLQDIPFFKDIKDSIEKKISSILPSSLKDTKKQEKEIVT